ncbi:hypothetical protein NC653_018152 [Populus alba x Populus x berolinensis]|uniref:Endonuclease/exonuclease/phosphatase domain-containing protein n=1 Tax=Populus alba x Populus x berolinensis TaxID=444605 RepID=A0AAD6QFV7_9ROSI|nr:hypothetical protein NC653_018152 [Populus alba x Populus x berolinensis]
MHPGGSSKFFRSPTLIPAIGKLDLPSVPICSSSIPICLPNDTTLNQSVVYEYVVEILQALTGSLDTLLEHALISLFLLMLIKRASQIRQAFLLVLLRIGELALFSVWGRGYTQQYGHDKGKTVVGDTCLDPMHMEADEWETMRGKHTKKLLSPRGNNVQAVELHAGLSVGVSTRSGGRKHANKGQGRALVTSYEEVTDFRECCSDLGLADLNSTGCLYTWSNGHVWSKIDRVMVNTHWSTLQQQAQVHFDNPGAFSDHSPSSIQIGYRQPCRNKNFKFFNMWADHPQFLELIEQC